MDAHARGIDGEIGGVSDRLEQASFELDGLAQREVLAAHGVLAARLGEAPQQLLLAREQEQHLTLNAAALELIQEPRNGRELCGGGSRGQSCRRALVSPLSA